MTTESDTPPVQTTEPKKRKGRGPTVARIQIAVNCMISPSEDTVTILPNKFATNEAALKYIEAEKIEHVRYLTLPVSAEVRLTAKIG